MLASDTSSGDSEMPRALVITDNQVLTSAVSIGDRPSTDSCLELSQGKCPVRHYRNQHEPHHGYERGARKGRCSDPSDPC